MIQRWLILAVIATVLVAVLFPWILKGIKIAWDGWQSDPVKMIARLVVALIIGQGIGWLLGFDQIGFFMKPFFKVGAGVNISVWLAKNLPATTFIGWTAKAIEILADAVKIPVEGAVFLRYGFCPDAVATLVTQPLWSTIEVIEKAAGAVVNSHMIGTREQIELSIGCIYGSCFRYLQNLIIWFFGIQIYGFLGVPVENFLHWIIRIISR